MPSSFPSGEYLKSVTSSIVIRQVLGEKKIKRQSLLHTMLTILFFSGFNLAYAERTSVLAVVVKTLSCAVKQALMSISSFGGGGMAADTPFCCLLLPLYPFLKGYLVTSLFFEVLLLFDPSI